MSAFLARVRSELSGFDAVGPAERRVELAAIVRVGGPRNTEDGRILEFDTPSFPAARRGYRLLVELTGMRPQLTVRRGDGTTLHRLRLEAPPRDVVTAADPHRPWPPTVTEDPQHAAAVLRGSLLVRGSCSEPGRPVHLELPLRSVADARTLADAAQLATGTRPACSAVAPGARLVWKSGEAVGALLATVGAMQGFLEWEERRLRRQVRADATRLANADAANVRRSVRAAAEQLAAVEQVVERLGWDALDADLREVALVRLANPNATLAELGELCDPPIGKSAVHRRLARVTSLLDA